ncbi:hypothetical protein E1B28_005454 [Marasmius oreades]|uniref:Major facilitator superfamily (MFS) profile domain-containing protein n=1 Tax=Marasmius oreades TaxID=181124 RepID=A0A9P7S3V7_9AGAR|nr:uncharacterized protein E1B28_005454 [Marasmius oreades]KAG7094630.1 hypothetical protein E1B28_005454 [Marasmius oreades]
MADETSPLISGNDSTRNHGSIIPASDDDNNAPVDGSQVEAEETESRKEAINPLWIVAPMGIGIFLSAMDQTIIIASYAAIGSELKQLQKTSWIATSYMLTVTAFQPLFGKLSDIFGRKTCLLFAYCIFGIGILFCGLSQTMDQLILSQAFAGIGGGGMPAITSIIMSDVVPLRSRGTWQGVLNIIFSTGSMVGAPLGGFLTDTIGWRWAFLVQFPALILAFISVSFTLHLPPHPTSDFKSKFKRIDFGGALSLILSIFFLLYGLERGGNIGWNDRYTLGALSLSSISFIGFGIIEMSIANEPFAPKRIIVNGSLIASYFVNFFGVASQIGVIFQTSLYMQAVHEFSAARAGSVLLPGILGGVSGSLVGGLVIQSTGRYWLVTVVAYGLQVMGILVVVLGSGVVVVSVFGICVGLLVSGFGNGGGITTSLVALISNAGREDQAIATAVSYLFRSLGSVVGLSVGSTVLQDTLRKMLRRRLVGSDVDVDEIVRKVRESLKYLDQLDSDTRTIVKRSYEDAIHNTFWVSFGTAICGFLFSLFIKEKRLDWDGK